MEDYLRSQLGFGDAIDAIRSFILTRGQELYTALIGSLDSTIHSGNFDSINKQLFLIPQQDNSSFAFRADFDHLLRNFAEQQETQSFLDSRTKFAGYFNGANHLLEELNLQVAEENNKAYGYFLRGIKRIKKAKHETKPIQENAQQGKAF